MINDRALAIIKEFEGFKSEAYLDKLAKPPVWTIGYGTTERAGVGIVPRAGMKISEREAAEYLRKTVDKFGAQVKAALTRDANPNEFGAMVSLAYNIGPGAFRGSSVLRHFNAGNKKAAADAFLMWNKAGGKVWRGLERRRAIERELFLSPVDTKPVLVTEAQNLKPPLPKPVAAIKPADPVAKPSLWAALGRLFAAIFRGRK